MGKPSVPLSKDLPPLILGTATFNSQYNPDPHSLPTTAIVHRALSAGIRAFDTSPYYGPAEELLGRALSTPFVRENFPRYTYRLLTKVGRIAASSFDYSPTWIRKSIRRSLSRLDTPYLDVVYCHDVEFVSAEEVLGAVRELRRIRDEEGSIHYIGISGYPVDVLCSLAELVLRETGEPLDAVMSYANFTLQNTKLATEGLPRLLAAKVDVVPNASPLGMGLLRRDGVPIGSMGDFHPAPDGLRSAIHAASKFVDGEGEKLEVIAIRYALESWLVEGARVGALGPPLAASKDADPGFLSAKNLGVGERLGVSVMGVSNLEELNETLRVWSSIIDGLENRGEDAPLQTEAGGAGAYVDGEIHQQRHVLPSTDGASENPPSSQEQSSILTPSGNISDHRWSYLRCKRVLALAATIRDILGPEWVNYTWSSPEEGFVNIAPKHVEMPETEAFPGVVEPNPALLTPPLDAMDG